MLWLFLSSAVPSEHSAPERSCGAHCLIMVGAAFIVSTSEGPLQHNKRKFADIKGCCYGMIEAIDRMQSTFLVI
jgi:hypothetical protein